MTGGRRLVPIASVIGVAAAVAAGLWVIGSPAGQRLQRLDARRVADLRALARSIDLYWSRHAALPTALPALGVEPGVGDLPRDPETGASYEYRAAGTRSYELCAAFAGASEGDQGDFWVHGPGRQCFAVEVERVPR